MTAKWKINLKAKSFSEVVWQCDDTFTSEELNAVIRNWAEMVQCVLVALSEERTTGEIIDKLDGDYYPFGDLANFLENIEIEVEE